MNESALTKHPAIKNTASQSLTDVIKREKLVDGSEQENTDASALNLQ